MAQQNIFSLLQELQEIESFLNYIQDGQARKRALDFLSKLYNKYNDLLQHDGNKPTVLVDMDEVLADLTGPWLELYNKDYDDNLTTQDLTDWDTTLFAKPECGPKIYDYLKSPGLFRYLPVREHAKEFIQSLVDNDIRVLIVSDSPAGHGHCDYSEDANLVGNPADDKRKWLAEHFPMIPQSQIVFTSQKWFVRGDIIVDDKPATFLEFQKRGRHAVLVDQPYNRFIETENRALDLKEAKEKVLELIGIKETV